MRTDITELEVQELSDLFLCYCTFVSLTHGKKLNVANVFLLFLQNDNLKELFKLYLEVDSDFDAVKVFLFFDPSLYKSKYVAKYLNKKRSENFQRTYITSSESVVLSSVA